MSDTDSTNKYLEDVRHLMADSLSDTVLRHLSPDSNQLFGSGKMLRSRLAFRVGPAAEVPHRTLLYGCAAVEMIHAASLLHDDVIDGGHLRRSLPTFWVERGVPGAILVGDLMLFKAMDIVAQVEDTRLLKKLIKLTGEVCDAESEQELLLRNTRATWENCVQIARRKTGALFAFSAFMCGGDNEELSAALCESGYAVGTAYQLADDVLDAHGSEVDSGKSHGSDEARKKTTAVTSNADNEHNPAAYVESLCREAEENLSDWPDVQDAWRSFMEAYMQPALAKNLQHNPS